MRQTFYATDVCVELMLSGACSAVNSDCRRSPDINQQLPTLRKTFILLLSFVLC